ncbi:preprotein translocase subunit SecG [Persicobacter diffluens]|uniref:Protein-export membrane protein SecG n=1 Tax=Persicobacter diffluens TaxID=981 RepID=A0AAN4VV21_9BACT|nr:preprotein translocase subunit SecG [Persicobacter diffluens]
MFTVLIGVIIVAAILLVVVVLAQNPKGGGLSSQFGGSSTSQIMGVKKTTDFLEKVTWGLAIAIVVLTLSTNFFIEEQRGAGVNTFNSPNLEKAGQSATLPNLGGEASDATIEGETLETAPATDSAE